MLDWLGETGTVALVGFGGGAVLGLAARLGRFCTLGAIEDLLYGDSDVRMRMWAVAVGTAILGVFALATAGLLSPDRTFYVAGGWNPVAHVAGGLLFGYGMALTGSCGYGALARLGGGDLRAFVVVLVMGVAAYAAISGPLAALRVTLFPQDLLPGPASVPAALSAATGLAPAGFGLLIGAAILAAALAPARMRSTPGPALWAAAVGLAVVSGWVGTTWVAETGFAPITVESHTFAAPLGDTLLYAMLGSGLTLGFGIGSVAGVLAGAFLGSLRKGRFRWEACEDPRELRRQIGGAVAMGIGGAVALGCTIGQGITAFSVLAFGAPLTLAAILAGAWIGLRQLIRGFAPG